MKEYKFKINGNEYNVVINSVEGKNADVQVNGVNYNVELESAPAAAPVAAPVAAPAKTAPVAAPAAQAAPAAVPAGGKNIQSPLPGVILNVCVSEGAAVKKGQKVAVLEAMKMENEILAEFDGTVTKIFVKQGDSVLEGANIVTLG